MNVHQSVDIGRKLKENFKKKLPAGFYDSIPKKIVTMTVTKHITFHNENKISDLNGIYLRIIGLLSSSIDIDVKQVTSH